MRTACALLGALVVSMLAPAPGSAAEPPTPPGNLQFGPLPGYCRRPDPPATCGNDAIYYLDQARATMGLAPYALPADFLASTPDRQMLILADLDRVAYGLPPIEGLNAGLGAEAEAAAKADEDPYPSEADLGQPLDGFTSNWAAGFQTTLAAYFFWMYADGYGSGNVDCHAPTDASCWGHRRDILWAATPSPRRPEAYLYSMGAATTTDLRGLPAYALSVVASNVATPPSWSYSWAQAVAEGAGTNPYPVSPPLAEKALLTVAVSGRGLVYGAIGSCRRRCHKHLRIYEPIRLRAVPAPGYRFVGWDNCLKGRYATCTTELEADQTIKAIFNRRRSPAARHG